MKKSTEDTYQIIDGVKKAYFNLNPAQLVEMAVRRGEGVLSSSGALRVSTGKYTGRSPNDKFIVDSPAIHDNIAWSSNKPFSVEKFQQLYHRMKAYMQNREVFIFDGFAGADKTHQLGVRFINEFAWQNLFVHQLFVRPKNYEKDMQADFKVLCMPGFKADPAIDGTNSEAFIIVNFIDRLVLIGGTHYAGEMKKSIFSVMNYLLPARDILSMHCAANVGNDGSSALFFGLSGTGKTTLSADPNRSLVGDDEHGWSEDGIFNFEGGCYAKCIKLSRETEPQIWDAIKFGAVLENVIIGEESRQADYESAEITENTRVAYPIDYIPNACLSGVAGHPKTIIFLTADAFGVLPPIAKLSKEQAMYHFMSGYTSKLAGTERGITEPEATFSACFGAPFLPRSPLVYAKLLGEKLEKYATDVFFINTGWSGGPYGIGKRMKLKFTRAMVTAAINGQLSLVQYKLDRFFNIYVPTSCPDVPPEILEPRNTWENKELYDKKAAELANLFIMNFAKFQDVTEEIRSAGPRL